MGNSSSSGGQDQYGESQPLTVQTRSVATTGAGAAADDGDDEGERISLLEEQPEQPAMAQPLPPPPHHSAMRQPGDAEADSGKHVQIIAPHPEEEDRTSETERKLRLLEGYGARRQQSFRRKSPKLPQRRRKSLRPASVIFDRPKHPGAILEPNQGLAPLVRGGIDGVKRPPARVKSVPAFAPYRRMARHRNFYLWWINEFRHWWKSSRLLVRLAGLGVYASWPDEWMALTTLNILKKKGPRRGVKLFKHLGQGGFMRPFLKGVRPFTRSLRILVGGWRWAEAAKCRRGEVGVEEFMAFIGNRVSRYLSRLFVDGIGQFVVFPIIILLIEWGATTVDGWHSAIVLIVLGVIRAISPYAASFQGSRFGRVVTRATFHSAGDRWDPTMRVNDVNLRSADCCEGDEVSANADLVVLAKKVAAALGKDITGSDTAGDIGSEHRTNYALEEEVGFHQVGCGSGGYGVYAFESEEGKLSVLLHVTPYGPSILDEMPRYVVLEREESQDTRGAWSDYVSEFMFIGPPVVEGYCYKGAFFSPWQFAEMKERYDTELIAYDQACRVMCKRNSSLKRSSAHAEAVPPTDLPSLKAFLETGRPGRDRKKGRSRYKQLQTQVKELSNVIHGLMQQKTASGDVIDTAPWGVILYFEGLDCAGKSSTGGLVQAALEQAGYDVDMRQYNRPPTEEQKKRPWMDRFEKPDTAPLPAIAGGGDGDGGDGAADDNEHEDKQRPSSGHRHTALVWDRGPAGDFVYGALAKADDAKREACYQEFMDFDAECRRQNILFCKLLFVTDRDAIARTLGKRLAQKKICRDLHTWLDASTGLHGGEITREGLDEIEMHIDPTDFIAFNRYHHNLEVFVNFARHTDTREDSSWYNPWLVVSTAKRHPARMQLLKSFKRQVKHFSISTKAVSTVLLEVMDFFGISLDETKQREIDTGKLVEMEMSEDPELKTLKKGLSTKTLLGVMVLLSLLYIYGFFTYDF